MGLVSPAAAECTVRSTGRAVVDWIDIDLIIRLRCGLVIFVAVLGLQFPCGLFIRVRKFDHFADPLVEELFFCHDCCALSLDEGVLKSEVEVEVVSVTNKL